jgi:hypothetical protein
MTDTMFATPDELMKHLITALPPSRAKADDLFRNFQQSGYIARQEPVGLTVMSKLLGANLYVVLGEGSNDAPGQTQVVMLSHPSFGDDEFDSSVEVVQTWSAGLDIRTRTAFSRKIRELARVEDGIPLNVLHREMPAKLLFSYRRPRDFVIVIDPLPGKRRIYATRNIG